MVKLFRVTDIKKALTLSSQSFYFIKMKEIC